MIDHLLRFNSEDEARADKSVGAYWNEGRDAAPGNWRGDVCIADVTVMQVSTAKRLDGWFINISQGAASLLEHPAAVFVFDRVAANAGQKFVALSAPSKLDFSDLAFSPVFAGSSLPLKMDAMNRGKDAVAKASLLALAFADNAVVKDEPIEASIVAVEPAAAEVAAVAKP